MSVHEGVSCDACGKSNFRSKRFKCLICYDYDLCSTCYENGETSSHHTAEHPMQCILTRHDFELFYQGERYSTEQAQSFTCPFCGEMGFSLPFTNESKSLSLQNVDLFQHLQLKHVDEQQSSEIICPICASMTNGEPNFITGDLLSHIANDHQYQQVQTPSSAGTGSNPYSRQTSSSNREFDFTTGSNTRGGFRRGLLRAPSRRGVLGGRGGGTVSQHFFVDASSLNSGGDPIADLLTQLSTVRRLAAANNNNTTSNSSSSSNNVTLQHLTRQQYERERLRTSGRSHHYQQQQHSQPTSSTSPSASRTLPSIENDLFDSIFSSALLADSPSTTNNTHQTWVQIFARQQSTSEQQQQQQQSSTTKTSTTESNSSFLRKLCDKSSSSTDRTNSSEQQKHKSNFVQNLLFDSFVCPLNDNDK